MDMSVHKLAKKASGGRFAVLLKTRFLVPFVGVLCSDIAGMGSDWIDTLYMPWWREANLLCWRWSFASHSRIANGSETKRAVSRRRRLQWRRRQQQKQQPFRRTSRLGHRSGIGGGTNEHLPINRCSAFR